MPIKPLHDRVLLKRADQNEEQKSTGGIIIPETAKEKPVEAEVVAVGEGTVNDKGTKVPLTVKAGDKVLFGKYSGTEVKYNGQEYLIVRESELLAIID
jgi:chaperonin GroES